MRPRWAHAHLGLVCGSFPATRTTLHGRTLAGPAHMVFFPTHPPGEIVHSAGSSLELRRFIPIDQSPTFLLLGRMNCEGDRGTGVS